MYYEEMLIWGLAESITPNMHLIIKEKKKVKLVGLS